MTIDISFDPRTEAGERDPDRHSPTLRRHHQQRWSTRLPGGELFELSFGARGEYLHHVSQLGEFWLSSDNIVATYSYWQGTADLIAEIPPSDIESFDDLGSTVGGTLVFPSNRVGGAQTINARRGSHPAIRDRFDLTPECMRRHYDGVTDSPLGDTLRRHTDFFGLFQDFAGYLEFFLLQDLVDDVGGVRHFLPNQGFDQSPVPRHADEYQQLRLATMSLVRARNQRIAAWAAAQTP